MPCHIYIQVPSPFNILLTPRVNLFLLNLIPPSILVREIFPSPQLIALLIALSTTRIGQTVKIYLHAFLMLLQNLYSATLSLLEAAISPMSILLRLLSIDTTFTIRSTWRILPCQTISPPRLCQICWRFIHYVKNSLSTTPCPLCAHTGQDR